MKGQGSGENVHYNEVFFPILFTFTGMKNTVRYSEDFIISVRLIYISEFHFTIYILTV